MKLGARIFKTGLAIMLSLYLAMWFGLEPPMFAALAAGFAIQPSIYRTFQTILDQVQANVIGAVLGVIFVMTFGHEPFVVGLVVVLAIAIIIKIKLESSTIPLAIVTIIIIMESPAENFVDFATDRFVLIALGVFAAFLVNLFFIPPQYETKLYHKIVHCTDEITQWLMLFLRKDADPKTLKKDLSRLDEKLSQIENMYLLYEEERNYFLKSQYGKARKVVLFRQMMVAANNALAVLKKLERRSDEFHQMPEALQKLIEEQLQLLTSYHDRILLRYIGKVNNQHNKEMIEELIRGKAELTDAYMERYTGDSIDRELWIHLLPAISQILEYQEQLEHLEQLVDSFFSYHHDENKVKVMDEE
ncbi:FUSC family protein [Halalkalibacterium ligniniphilum]|uniref:FUSC family protein n=1 Tax=Halalkalibacterium ligniniphilum TaxID=1134413 RepID=UPI00034C2AB3|nr:aromatic acid exporter family protein [Halalkalibacterium ligniniphilum]